MLSVITNIFNKKTKGPTLMELFTATWKLKKGCSFFFLTRGIRCVHHGWHGTHRYGIEFLATRVNMSASIFFTAAMIRTFRSASSHGNVGKNIFAYFVRNTRCTVTTDLLCDIATHKTTSPPERSFSHYMHSHCLVAETWNTMKNNFLGTHFWVVSSTCTGFVKTCPTAFLQ